MFKEFFLAMASGFGFVSVPDRNTLFLQEKERQFLFVQREGQRYNELRRQQDELRRQQDELRRQQAELRRREEEKSRLARQQAELCRKQQELARQNEAEDKMRAQEEYDANKTSLTASKGNLDTMMSGFRQRAATGQARLDTQAQQNRDRTNVTAGENQRQLAID